MKKIILTLTAILSVAFASASSMANEKGTNTKTDDATTMQICKSEGEYILAQQDNDCYPWQYKNRYGNCVDRPNVFRPSLGYVQPSNVSCWSECLCREGQMPMNESCSPCSFVGIVCIPD